MPAGIGNMSLADLEREVLAGGRIVLFQYCISILIMTFKRSSDLVFIKSDDDGFSPAFSNSIISLFAGWWGIPWGPIYTISTVAKNASGGTDVTREFLADRFGLPRANAIMAQRQLPAPKGNGLKYFRWSLIGLISLPFLIIGLLMFSSAFSSSQRRLSETNISQGVGSTQTAAFNAANAAIGVNHGKTAFGNTEDARQVASMFSVQMRTLRNKFFTGTSSGVATKGDFLTYCELQTNQCVILVHVPELRKFNFSAKKSLGEVAWLAAQATLSERGLGKPGMRMAIGIRGVLLYDRVLEGSFAPEKAGAKNAYAEIDDDAEAKARLAGYFAP
jgi:hypothetical protein